MEVQRQRSGHQRQHEAEQEKHLLPAQEAMGQSLARQPGERKRQHHQVVVEQEGTGEQGGEDEQRPRRRPPASGAPQDQGQGGDDHRALRRIGERDRRTKDAGGGEGADHLAGFDEPLLERGARHRRRRQETGPGLDPERRHARGGEHRQRHARREDGAPMPSGQQDDRRGEAQMRLEGEKPQRHACEPGAAVEPQRGPADQGGGEKGVLSMRGVEQHRREGQGGQQT